MVTQPEGLARQVCYFLGLGGRWAWFGSAEDHGEREASGLSMSHLFLLVKIHSAVIGRVLGRGVPRNG
jgi:hypothetical protein